MSREGTHAVAWLAETPLGAGKILPLFFAHMPTASPGIDNDLWPWVSAALFIGVGAAALLLFTSASGRRPRALLYFAAFMAIYGVRLLVDSEHGEAALGLSFLRADQLESVLRFLIPIPAILYVRELVEGGLRRILGALALVTGTSAAIFLALDLVRQRSDSGTVSGNVLALVFLGALAIGLVRRWTEIRSSIGDRPSRILAAGSAAFVLFAFNQSLVGLGLVPWRTSLEHVGLLSFTLAIGYVTAVRANATQSVLTAMDQELRTARRIQGALLPGAAPRVTGLRFAARFQPMSAVGGDFYDYFETSSGAAVLIADAAGHGVSAALLASMFKVASAAQRTHAERPAAALTAVNGVLCDAGAPEFASAAWLYVGSDGSGRYGAAGHPPMIVLRAGTRAVERIEENGFLLGAFPGSTFSERELTLQAGDRALLYTDGFLEAVGPAGEEVGIARLEGWVRETGEVDLETQATLLVSRLVEWRDGAPQTDDVTLVLLEKVRPGATHH